MGAGGGDNDDMDNVLLSVRMQAMNAQPSMPAKDVVVVDISDSTEGMREVELVQPRTEPIPYPQLEPETSAMVGGMFTPDEPTFVDLGGDPNMISTESSSPSEESENINPYYIDRDPSPSRAATSKAREPLPPMDSRESVGQEDIAGEPVSTVAAQQLRGEEEDNFQELPHLAARGPSAGQHGTASTSTPSGSHQHSSANSRIRSTESFLGRVAGGSSGISNASALRGLGLTIGRDVAAEATSPHSPACSTS